MGRRRKVLTVWTDQSSSNSDVSQCVTPEERGGWTGYHPLTLHCDPPSLRTGYAVIAASFVFMAIGIYATFISAFVPKTGWVILDIIAEDTHYKYIPILLVPTVAYFVIANWVGWQFYRNS